MKKALLLILALAVLGACGMGYVFAETNAAKDQVAITELAQYGDTAAADGLEITVRTHYDSRLFWDTTYVTETAQAQTDFLFSQAQINFDRPWEYSGVASSSSVEYGFDMAAEGENKGIAAAYQALFERTSPGSEQTETVYLKDYYEYYPLSVTLEFPDCFLSWDGNYAVDEEPVWGTEEYIIRSFQKFFRIPVLEQETTEISVSKNVDGSIGGMGSDSTESDAFYLWTMSTLIENGCFFTFDTHTNQGAVVDTSLIPGGYGIYYLPYYEGGIMKDGSKYPGVDIDAMSMVYALDPAAKVVSVSTNQTQDKLLVLTEENQQCVLAVLEVETMACLQRLELAALGPEGNVWNVYFYDDFFVLWLSGNQLVLVETAENGSYVHRFTVTTDGGDELANHMSYSAVMDWDGQRLAVSDVLSNNNSRSNGEFYNKYCSFSLAVYDETGLLYFGNYLSSLDIGSNLDTDGALVQRIYFSPLSVRWQDS